jgi:hypothetical protein
MRDLTLKEEVLKFPLGAVCKNCRTRLVNTDTQFSKIDWGFKNGFKMIEKSCHICKHGTYAGGDEFKKAVCLTCDKMAAAGVCGEIADPKRYVCNLWEQYDEGR